jgi:hypothetical protein
MLRIPLPIEQIDEIDDVIRRGIGGFRDRQELIAEALNAYLLELRYGHLADERAPSKHIGYPPLKAGAPHGRAQSGHPGSLLGLPECVTIDGAAIRVTRGPLFGLHSRDFPSIWAAWQLADMTKEKLVSQAEFLKKVIPEAWEMGSVLRADSAKRQGAKLEALFPTNRTKTDSSGDAFKSFAIGTCSASDGELRCSGPLFLWNVCAAQLKEGNIYLGLTSIGRDLLKALDGISALIPHEPQCAGAFIKYLQEHAPEDWWGFHTVTKLATSNPTREELLTSFRRERDHLETSWTDHQVGSYATGYISRCREWGILEPKLLHGKYRLTEYGLNLHTTMVEAIA